MNHPRVQRPREDEYVQQIMAALRSAGWEVREYHADGEEQVDLLAEWRGLRYVIDLKASPDARRPILQALLAGACLQARHCATSKRARPLAVVCAPHLSDTVLADLRRYAQRYLGDCAYGFLDSRGRVELHGDGLEPRPAMRKSASGTSAPRACEGEERLWRPPIDLFGDLGGWMIKVLLAGRVQGDFLHAPAGPIRNAKHLAEVANVSVASAWRQVRGLERAGYLEERSEGLRLVRVGDLLREWARCQRPTGMGLRARWLVSPADGEAELRSALRRYLRGASVRRGADAARSRPLVCLGLHSACRHLGLGIVQGVPSCLYLGEVTPRVLRDIGLRECVASEGVDVHLLVPRRLKSVFRAAVVRHGIPAADAVQCWLDLQGHPLRGEEQAREIWDRVLAPLEE